jgi:tRNA(Ile)-lysidine synthase
MKNIKKTVKNTIVNTVGNPKSICVALSGGADSVCLLHILKSLSVELGFFLSAVHINHNIRGKEAKRDADFCNELCKNLNIPFEVFDVRVLEQAKKGESVELAARRMRYEVFEKINAEYIATAHNVDDSLETFLINFCRGTGLKGLTGIPDLREKFIRPLNRCSKADILGYICENKLDFVVDSTNLSNDYTRNKIRNNVVPLLKEISPELLEVSARNISLLKIDNDYIESEAKKLYILALEDGYLKIPPLKSAHKALKTRVLSAYSYDVTNRHPDNLHINLLLDLLENGGPKVELYSGFYAEVKKNCFVIKKDEDFIFSVETEMVSKEEFENFCKINKLLLKNAIDYDKIFGELIIRGRQARDRLSPLGRGLSKPVRRLQAEADLPIALRDKAPIAVDEKGAVWGYKIGVDERASVDENTQNILVFKVYKTQKRGE